MPSRQKFGWLIAASSLLVFIAVNSRAQTPAPAPAPAPTAVPTKVAIANPVRIFSQLKETQDFSDKMESDAKTENATFQKRQSEMDDLKQSRDLLKPDSPQWARANETFMSRFVEFQTTVQISQAMRAQKRKLQIKSLYERITLAVQKVAVQRGFDVVITENREEIKPEEFERMTEPQLASVLRLQSVLYSSPQVDLSDQVIALMDAEYKNRK